MAPDLRLSWGRAHRSSCTLVRPAFVDDVDIAVLAAASANGRILAHGLGRSYGDSPLNDGGLLIETSRLDRLLHADWQSGIVRAEPGLTLDELIRISLPHGWFPPVVPGTRFVTLAGAVANDVHGKNHHVAGSFGAHVRAIGLRRSDRGDISLTPGKTPELFASTLGGLGLTGFITWVELQMTPVHSAELVVERRAFGGIEGFFELSAQSVAWPYTVAWVDCFAPPRSLGRGWFSRGRPAEDGPRTPHASPKLTWPIETPGALLNRVTIGAFNAAYYNLPRSTAPRRVRYEKFFFPLDGIQHWNRLYGARGFYQHQSLIPLQAARDGIAALLSEIRDAGQGSFLGVVKVHGPELSPGRLTFGGAGVSLAFDFSNKGPSTLALLDRLDDITRAHGGRLYLAKDGRMSGAFFRESYPAWKTIEADRDAVFSSSFWRRVTEET